MLKQGHDTYMRFKRIAGYSFVSHVYNFDEKRREKILTEDTNTLVFLGKRAIVKTKLPLKLPPDYRRFP